MLIGEKINKSRSIRGGKVSFANEADWDEVMRPNALNTVNLSTRLLQSAPLALSLALFALAGFEVGNQGLEICTTRRQWLAVDESSPRISACVCIAYVSCVHMWQLATPPTCGAAAAPVPTILSFCSNPKEKKKKKADASLRISFQVFWRIVHYDTAVLELRGGKPPLWLTTT